MLRIHSSHYCTCSSMTLRTLHCMCFVSARVPLLFLCVRGRIRVIFKCVSAHSHCACFSYMRKQVPLGRKVLRSATSCSALFLYAQASPPRAQGFEERDFLQRAHFFDARVQLQRIRFFIARLHLTMREF
jgi:hypothetical protein